jgi:hypothetical protein
LQSRQQITGAGLAMTMKNPVFCDVVPRWFNINRRFGGTCCLNLQRRSKASEQIPPPHLEHQPSSPSQGSRSWNTNLSVNNRLTLFLVRVLFFTLKIEEIRSSETSLHIKPTQRHIPEEWRIAYPSQFTVQMASMHAIQ